MHEHSTVWKAFEANEITHSAAHYLLAISDCINDGEPPRAVDVARQLGVSRAAVSSQLRALRDHGLVRQDSDYSLHLTRPGEDLVARVATKRDVLKAFLTEILGVSETTAETDACKVEHLLSEESGAALMRLLRFLRSGHPAAKACMELIRLADIKCKPDDPCDFCAGPCLLEIGATTENGGSN